MNNKSKFRVHIPDEGKKKKAWVVFASVFLVTLLLGGCVWLIGDFYYNKPINEVDNSDETSRMEQEELPDDLKQKQINLLVAGIDSGTSRSTNLTDVLMLVHVDLVNKKVNVLQIPRDTYVDNAVWTGKINAVYNVGNRDVYGRSINGLLNCVSDKFKVHVDNYVIVNLDGFRDIVDAMGGVKITFDEDFSLWVDEKYWNFKAGEQTLTGKQAEIFVRERNSRGGDLGRVQKGQRVFLAALIKQAKAMKKSDMLKMVPTLFKYVNTDMTLSDAVKILNAALDIPTKDIGFDMVPGEGCYINKQSCYSVHLEPLVAIINEKFRANMDPIAASDLGFIEVKNTTDAWDKGGQGLDDVNS